MKHLKYFFSVFFLLITLSVISYFAVYTYNSAREEQEANLLAKTNTVTRSISPKEISTLNGLDTDINLSQYKELKDKLISIRAVNPEIRFIYLMQKKGEEVVFMVDSEPADSKDYSPPGQVYSEAQQDIFDLFENGESIVEPVYADRWGRWASGLARLEGTPENQQVIVGMDIEASKYIMEPWIKTLPFFFLMFIVMMITGGQIAIRKKELEIIDAKSQFVSIASHELRAPLTGIRWASEALLQDHNLNEKERELADGIHNSCLKLLTIIGDLLNLATAEKKLVDNTKFEKIEIMSAINEAIDNLKHTIQERKVDIQINNLNKVEKYVNGDKARLSNVFTNLLLNAIKYSNPGSQIKINIKNSTITFEDQGIGIPKHDQAKVLQGFYRSPNAKKHSVMGTGIGLFLCKKIIIAHKGSLALESELGKGTKAIVTLPNLN